MLHALLTLALAATYVPAALPAGHLEAVERLPLAQVEGPITARTEPFEARVVVEAPRDPADLAKALKTLSRLLCPMVEAGPRTVVLHCRSTRVEGSVVAPDGRGALELRELAGLPGTGEGAMPILFQEPGPLGLGTCANGRAAARGECLLKDGKRGPAADAFRLALLEGGPGADHAHLRLGDLALSAGNTTGALAAWAEVGRDPWKRLAEARRCEMTRGCLDANAATVYATEELPAAFAADLRLRAARARAFAGDPVAAVRALADEWKTGACAGEQPLCRRILLAALRAPGTRREEVLGVHLSRARTDGGAYALELALAAARLAEDAGAPGFAAGLLASVAGEVTPTALPEHLLRTAELYVAARDPIRADVVLEFARSRLDARALASRRWVAVAQATSNRGLTRTASRPPSPVSADPIPELAVARATLARAKALPGAAP